MYCQIKDQIPTKTINRGIEIDRCLFELGNKIYSGYNIES